MFNKKKIAELEAKIKKLEDMMHIQSTTETETVWCGLPFAMHQQEVPKRLQLNSVVTALLNHLGATIQTKPASGEKLEIVTTRRKK